MNGIKLRQMADIVNMRYKNIIIKTISGTKLYDGIMNAYVIKEYGDYNVINITPMTKLIYTDDEVLDYFSIEVML